MNVPIIPEDLFGFLSGSQIMRLSEISPRQRLATVPQKHNPSPSNSNALIYIFVSHRWELQGSPDASRKQLRTLQGWLRLVEELVLSTISPTGDHLTSWPNNLVDMVEGMPQATSLVARIRETVTKKENGKVMLQNCLDHIWLWYDCACLPQNFPVRRTKEEQVEFSTALQYLDGLVSQCELLCLRTLGDDYEERAWCSLEHFQKSLSKVSSEIELNCDKFLGQSRVQWIWPVEPPHVFPTDTSAGALRELGAHFLSLQLEHARMDQEDASDAQELQTLQLSVEQKGWELFMNNKTRCRVPDLSKAIVEMREMSVPGIGGMPPLLEAMEKVVGELQWATFAMSCRDAAALHKVPVPANYNECIPNVGIRCGLHCPETALNQDSLHHCIESCTERLKFDIKVSDGTTSQLVCPSGHALQPSVAPTSLRCDSSSQCQLQRREIVAGDVHATCKDCDFDICFQCSLTLSKQTFSREFGSSSQEAFDTLLQICGVESADVSHPTNDADYHSAESLTERRVTLDLYDLVKSLLLRYNQRCSNDGDVAFVGLLALRNLLGKEIQARRPKQLGAGVLFHVRNLARTSVDILSSKIAGNETITSLPVTVILKLPRWVLLDLANAQTLRKGYLRNRQGGFFFGTKALCYLNSHPESISFVFDQSAVKKGTLLPHQFCVVRELCNFGWAPCSHKDGKYMHLYMGSTLHARSTLDEWATTDLPTPTAVFGCVAAVGRIFVLGGATGDEDPDTKTYTTCSAKVYIARSPFTIREHGKVWDEGASLIEARRELGACLLRDQAGSPRAILVGGGCGTTIPGVTAPRLTSLEIFWFDRETWEPYPVVMPCSRVRHHMVESNGSLFIFGGKTEEPCEGQDCDILNLEHLVWLKGPVLPIPLYVGSLVVVRDQFAVLFGGVEETGDAPRAYGYSWVLNLKPWSEWSMQGGAEEHRPDAVWTQGPALPVPSMYPNICVAPALETGLSHDWVLMVSPLELGNYCFGLCLGDPTDSPDYWLSLRWHRLGATPECITMGAVIVSNRMLAIIGGVSVVPGNWASKHVHFRILSSACECPLPPSRSAERYSLFRGSMPADAPNDTYLMGRLGFPITEEYLIARDGTKRLDLLPYPPDSLFASEARSRIGKLFCWRCLYLTRSMEKARSDGNTLYGLRASATSRRVALCSSCLCTLFAPAG